MKRSVPPTRATLGLIQTTAGPDPADNLERTFEAIRHAAKDGAQIVCTQELFRTQYFCQTEDHKHFALAEPIPGPSTRACQQLARRHRIVLIASLFERRAPGLFHNTAIVVDADGTLLGCYRKMHIPDDPLFFEKFYFTPGDLGYRAWDTRFGRIGVLICWDQWFPEAARLTAFQGAEVILYPTAIGWHPAEKASIGSTQHDAWETAQRAHAIANGCFVAAVNRIGLEQPAGEPGLEFWGQSFVAAPSGKILARAPADRETNVLVEIDRSEIETARTHWPFLRDRRIDSYSDLARRWSDPIAPDGLRYPTPGSLRRP